MAHANTLSQNLRKRLKESGMTQVQLAEASGVGQTVISRFLSGRCSITIANAEKLLLLVDNMDKRKARQSAKEEVEEAAGA